MGNRLIVVQVSARDRLMREHFSLDDLLCNVLSDDYGLKPFGTHLIHTSRSLILYDKLPYNSFKWL